MCRTLGSHFSTKTASLPKASFDSLRARSSASSSSPGSVTTRMPRPPPPWAALTRVAPCSHEGACGADLLLGRAAKLDAWNHGDPGLQRQALGRHFVAHQGDHLGARPDEAHAALLAGARELRVLGEEAIARMDGVGTARPGHVQDLSD